MKTLLITIPDHPDLPQWVKGFKMPLLVLDTPVFYTLAEDEHAGNRRIIDKNLCQIVTGSKGLPVEVEQEPAITQEIRVLFYLQKHGSITQADANYKMKPGISRLAEMIRRLKNDADLMTEYSITDEWEYDENDRSIRWKRYHLQKIEK